VKDLEFRSFPLEIKDVGEDGTFEGYAAVFGNVDRVNDVIEPGAFKKTIAERPEVPIFWMHDPHETVGIGKLSERHKGLFVEGQLTLDVQRAREVHALMRDGAVADLSIGYKAMKKDYRRSVRHLKEVKVGEFSLLPAGFAANELAVVTAVKAAIERGESPERLVAMLAGKAAGDAATVAWDDEDGFQDLRADLAELLPSGCYVIDVNLALSAALVCNYLDDADAWVVPFALDVDGEPVAAPQDEWTQAERSWIAADAAEEALEDDEEFGKSALSRAAALVAVAEIKEGRVLSTASRKLLEQAAEAIQALLDAAEPAKKATRASGAATQDGEPASATRQRLTEDVRAMSALVRG
jgi:HK97 family phage prohead protease